MRDTLLAILLSLSFVSFSQSVVSSTKGFAYKNSFGISKDCFEVWPIDSPSNILYPYYQYTASYNHYFWGNDIIHGSISFGLGIVKKTYYYENINHNQKTHTTLHIPTNISLLLGKKNHFLVSGLGLFYNGTQIAPSPIMDIDDTVPAPKYFVNSVFTHFLIGYKGIIKKKFIVNLLIHSGRRDLFDFDSKNKIVVLARPHFQLKLEYIF